MYRARISNLLGKITILVVICCCCLPAQAKYGGGTGETNDPYQIWDANQMNAIGADSNDWDKHFKLMADVDLNSYTGTSFNIIGIDYYNPFTGTFDGNGHRISNFTYSSTVLRYIGIFGYIYGSNAEIKDLGLIDPNVDIGTASYTYIGALAGLLYNGRVTGCYVEGGSISGHFRVGGLLGVKGGTVENCHSSANVSGDWRVGGLMGTNYGGTTDCTSSGTVSGTEEVGGLVGWNDNGTISRCVSMGNVSGHSNVGGLVGHNDATISNCSSITNVEGHSHVGGLVGDNDEGTITKCYATGGVSGDGGIGGLVGYNRGEITNCSAIGIVNGGGQVGGLVGGNSGAIVNCYSTGSVSGVPNVGGLAGNNRGTITNCYSTSVLLGNENVGGLVGKSYYGTITNCYSAGCVSGNENVGGLVGSNQIGEVIASFWDIETSGQLSSAGGTAKTTAEMQTKNTFVAWVCDPAWTIEEGVDYPRLWWENKPGEIISIPYGGGSGEPNDPYLIYTVEHLNTISLIECHLDKHFKLMADIDLSAYTGTSFNIIGYYKSWNDTKPFTGIFDGNGHTISNFTYTSTDIYYIGLFGHVADPNAEINDLRLICPNVDAGNGRYVGSLVGRNSGRITNCYVDVGSVSGDDDVGGLVGYNSGTITNCYVEGNKIEGDFRVGVMVGSSGGTIARCYSTGSASGQYATGGLVGYNASTITKCYSTCSVSGDSRVGGLVGYHYRGTVNKCYSTGTVLGYRYVGGLVGQDYEGTIANCYSQAHVSGTRDVGGLVGKNTWCDYQGNCYEGEVWASFWDIETSRQAMSDGGTGLQTTEMQTQSTFTDAGWDFVGETFNGIEDIWFIPQQDYPHLWWEGMQVPMKLTPRKLNCRSEGNWVKAHLTLPQGVSVADVDTDRLAVLHSFGFESAPLYVFVNKDKLVEIEAAFEREAVCSLAGAWPQELTVAGFLADGSIFLGTSTVRIIHPGMKVIEELASCWLQGDCVHPTWCDRIDMNRDSLVNLLDYALLMNIEVEFVTDE